MGIIITLIDNAGVIQSHEQVTYIPIHDCNTKFNIYLLYRDRPKDTTKNYTIRIDAYDKINLLYLASWTLPVKFIFMPVNRVSAELVIPARYHCHRVCNLQHREQQKLVNTEFCRCESKNPQTTFLDREKCNCSSDSLCVGIVHNRSICLCPLTKMSPRCFIKSICQKNICMNGGLCVPHNDRISLTNFTCACQDGFSGKRCEYEDVKIDISFYDVSIPQSLLVHFITVGEHDLESKFYLTVLQHIYTPSVTIQTKIARSQYCPHIRELFNQTLIAYPIIRRIKYYHLACMKDSNLVCFHDNELFICLCTEEKHANCFHFDFNMTYDCMGSNNCQNGAQCFYGTQCQFSTQQFGLSLDAILGYQIRSNLSISRQSIYVKISIIVASIMLLFGLISGILSILTFQSKPCLKVGCGIYLLASSITSILTIICLNFKLWFLILSQMSILTSRSFLVFSCISLDFILRFLLAVTDWFHACVAVERLVTVIVDVKFNLAKSKTMAKLLIIVISLCTCVTFLHDPIHRYLIDDDEEQRTWCMVHFTPSIEIFNSFINIFHFIVPFGLKLISAMSIIGSIAKRRASVKKQNSYMEHIKKQFRKHKHLIISSSCLVILAMPRLVISFASGCMKSAREPLIFLIGYFVSFMPSLLTFFIFVSTSKTYEREFKTVIRQKWNAIRRRFTHYY
ncbi:unnamed protein product [Rotaria magnacalcarata]|uniref:Uncharacterized protein n=2 Tax=Rotaria magnacalcarata TaxID=392030 RepID=A0A815NXN6_9BILA|nr:unnamed protein product [Rotaria magnacalcarata]